MAGLQQGTQPKNSAKKVAVIPAYNEEKTISKVLLLTDKLVDQIIVVDDGSTDLTGDIARALGFITLKHEINEGKGAALRTGIRYAQKETNFDILITMDSDLQHDPNEIPLLLDPILQGSADVVIGVRPMVAGVMPRDRIIGNKLLDAMSNNKNENKHRDTQSGFRAYSASALSKIHFLENGMAIESQTYIDAVSAGLRIKEVPISTTYVGITPKRSRLNHFSSIIDYLLTRTIADSPLLYLGLPGIIGVLLGVLAGVRVVQIFVNNHQQIAAGTALISVTFIIIGAVLIATSLIIKLIKIQAPR
ncbi:MAG: glycosyltransferase family 2 protein [Thaumarchaeota archaeon]|nr:glycosyltransferase family 2 protein [Nitrososphaerota archaeon]